MSLSFIKDKILRCGFDFAAGKSLVESATINSNGSIAVVLRRVDENLGEEILDIGRRSMTPINLFYVVDGKSIRHEDVQDYYKTVHVPGFVGEPVDAPPEEVSKEVKGALRLRRVRAGTRGRPVVAWRVGDQEVRVGSGLKFDKEACLQWTAGRTVTIAPGASGTVSELSSRRPIAFIKVGDYDNVELPMHALGHLFSAVKPSQKNESAGYEYYDEKKKDDKSKLSPEFSRIMNAVGLGHAIGWGRDPDKDNVPVNQPFNKDRWIANRDGNIEDDIETEEDMLVADPLKNAAHPERKQKALIVAKK